MGRIQQMEISALEYLSTDIPMLDFMDISFRHFLLYNELQYSVALAIMSNDMTTSNCLDKR
jgi:hypothetical protein